jgi:diguanylate cyclase (GGDEF)-like protein/PAS domain S-box-containing protein
MPSAPLPPNKGDRQWALRRHNILNPLGAQVGQRHIGVGQPSRLGKGKSTTLRKKTRLSLGIALIGLIGVLYTASSSILLSSLKKVEEQETRQLVKGVLGAFAQTQDDFNSRFVDWTTWDDTYAFIEDANKHYIESNLAPAQLALVKLNLVLYFDSSGRMVFGTGFDPKTKQKTSVPQALRKHLSANALLLQHSHTKSNIAGIVLLPEGPMLISSRPILTSKGEGPIRGTIIFGRYLDADGIEKLARTTHLSLTMHELNEVQMPPDFQAVRSSLSVREPILVRLFSQQTIAGYALVTDIYGKPALILRVDMPRETYNQGQISLRYLFASLVVVGLIFAGVTLPLLERLILLYYERQEREERYRAVVTQASEGIFLVDADTKRFLEANAALQKLLGYTSEEVLGLTLYDAIADDRKSIDYDVAHMRTKKHHFSGERRYRCKNGSLVDVEVSANLISYAEKDAFCIVVRDITDRKQAEQTLRESERRLSWQASHDPLTELVNRREFEQSLQQAVVSATTSDYRHVLCYLDLDQFKIVNDTCGHVAGDELLRQVSTLFKTGLRKSDILARLGGDEFGILLYQCPLVQAVRIANMLRERIHKFRFKWEDKTFSIGVSIGLVVIDADTQSSATVLSAADTACYAAKNNGRNRVYIYRIDDCELVQQRGEMQWVSKIPKALEENRFRLYSQRIVPLAQTESKSEHCEVLLRLEDETGKIVSPMAFIPAAERYHQMHLIDRWVVSTLFAYLGQHSQENCVCSQVQDCPRMYAVNLSGDSINDDQFINFVQEKFALHRIPPSIICFEITETVAITNLAKTAEFISKFKALGCHFALDDFGSGMSSFAYLKNLPVDYLKIDGILIKDIVKDAIASEIVEAIARIASVMQIETIAEFVENDAILMKLKSLGVDYAQGYSIAEPCLLEKAVSQVQALPLVDNKEGREARLITRF